MLLHAVCSKITRWPGRAVRPVCASLLLLAAAHSNSFAGSLYPSGHETLLLAGFPAADEDPAGGGQTGGSSRESLTRNATFTSATSSHAGASIDSAAETAAGEAPEHTAAAENRIPDWNGVWRDTGILSGSQFVAAGIIYTMPQSASGWSKEQKNNAFENYAKNFVNPVWDKDDFYINNVLHPYWGAAYYIRGRERGLDKVPAFVYSTLISAMYEFGVECFFERPSIQDLIVTPVGGFILGAFIFEPWRESIKRKQELRWYDHAVLVFTDPVGALVLGIESLFGIQSTITVDYSVPQSEKRSAGSAGASKGSRVGILVKFPLN